MSGLDDNPFADPFKDPAVQRAARPSPAEEANPIKMGGGIPPPPQQHSPKTGYGGTSQTPPRPVQTAVPMNEDELFRQQEELRRREQELLQRQQEFQRQQMGGGGGPAQRPPHNWPPLPQFIPLQPCFYQDIDVEIPVQFQETVRLVYYVYLVYVLASVANVIGAFFYLMADGTIGLLLLAIIQLVIFTPCAFLFWFRPVYKAFRDDSSFNFMMFFLVLFFHTIFCMVQMLGLSYATGWTVTLHVFGTHWFIALIMLIPTLGFTAAFIGMVFSLIKVHQFYRGAGFSLDKARQEFSNGVMADRNVQNAANHAARAAANHAVNEMVSGRY